MLCRVCCVNEATEIQSNGTIHTEFCSRACHYESLKVPLAVVWERDERICHLCSKYVEFEDASRDHLVPRYHGGPTTFDNIALAHKRCNSRRGVRDVGEVRAEHMKVELVSGEQGSSSTGE